MYSQFLEREAAISFVKERFERYLRDDLNLIKVSSPIAVLDGKGINDSLNGVERPVSFPIKSLGEQRAQVVHSLAKWKRVRLSNFKVMSGHGIITNMHALRPDEEYTNIHSIYVDQWDWEQVISKEERTLPVLKERVKIIYSALKNTGEELALQYPEYRDTLSLPNEIKFIHSQQLLEMYPTLSAKEREREAAKRFGAIFIIGIGAKLTNGEAHDGRAPDYDDWSSMNEEGFQGLNGDIIVWHPVLKCALELSSMGVRVDGETLKRQLDIRGCGNWCSLQFHSMLLNGALPQSIGGGIGQSRVCMLLLGKKHIGEVQVGIWSDEQRNSMTLEGVELL